MAYQSQYTQLKDIIQRLLKHRRAATIFSQQLWQLQGKSKHTAPRNLHNKILDGTIDFTKRWSDYLEDALGIAQKVLHQFEPQNIHITDQADWIYLTIAEIKQFMIEEIRLSLERLPSPHPKEEQRHTAQLLTRFQHEKKLVRKVQPQLTAPLGFQIPHFRSLLGKQTTIQHRNALQNLRVAFPTGHTATAAVVLTLNSLFRLNWMLQYDITHSVYLQRSMANEKIIPHLVILADSLALGLFNIPKQRIYQVLGYLWQNEITVLKNTSGTNTKNEQQALYGDVYYNLSYPNSGADLLFNHYKQHQQINATIQPQHSSYEKALDVLSSDPYNFIITNDTQARLYEALPSIQRIPALSYFTDNLILFNDNYFARFKSRKSDVLRELKSLIYYVLYRLQWMDEQSLERLVSQMMADQTFLFHYLISKSIKLQN
ncbi:hypothetical protein [Microscilla marina]|uniref:Uncharacterized protein n=1 Tax=Microscilla marina ATCC 23134 TaxID=313606 RepID=A1ZK13_MICM2|nr:hypothetical protein [Microscilla marina]EAY29466.1 hypothetical protein M23134_01526 [Microscilla marina ATCC 23134]